MVVVVGILRCVRLSTLFAFFFLHFSVSFKLSHVLIFIHIYHTVLNKKAVIAWQPAEKKEERMPLELRDVNEGVAHYQDRAFSQNGGLLNGSSWIFSNKHFLYKVSVNFS
jgi:hypothetical protein